MSGGSGETYLTPAANGLTVIISYRGNWFIPHLTSQSGMLHYGRERRVQRRVDNGPPERGSKPAMTAVSRLIRTGHI